MRLTAPGPAAVADRPLFSQREDVARYRQVLSRFLHNRMTMLGIVIITVYLVAAAFPGAFSSYGPLKQDLANSLRPPSQEHLMGTDEFGRDVFSRILYGARLSFSIGFFAVVFGSLVGFAMGLIAGYLGGYVDMMIMRTMDILLAIPGILLAISIIAALGTGIVNVIIAIAIHNIPQFARLTRSTVLAVKNEDYVLVARAIGNSTFGTVRRHVIPNALGPPLVFATLRFSTAILLASGLSFLGLGVNPPTPEWGAMLAASRGYLRVAPHLAFAYGLTLSVLVLGFNSLGEGLRDVFDPRSPR